MPLILRNKMATIENNRAMLNSENSKRRRHKTLDKAINIDTDNLHVPISKLNLSM